MIYKFVIAVCFAFPFIGIVLMERGTYGLSINETGHRNFASEAFLAYTLLTFLTIFFAHKLRIFDRLGAGHAHALAKPNGMTFRALVALVPMLAFVLVSLGGLSTLLGIVSAGEFRAALGGGGALGYLIIKYYAPAVFACILMSNIAWNPRRLDSIQLILLGICLVTIAMSFGYKSAIVVALLPAAVLYFWKSSPWILLPLGLIATAFILFGYMFFQGISDLSTAFDRMTYRLFILQGDVAWKIWDLYADGVDLPAYSPTLVPVIGDRLFSMLTGLTRADDAGWVATHFGLLITHLSGYPYDVIMAGHNNTATVFSEGLIAGGIAGLALFAVLGGLLIQAVYKFIDNRLAARDFVSASIASSYFVMGLMSWLIGGGITSIIHISIAVAFISTYVLLRFIVGPPRKVRVSVGRSNEAATDVPRGSVTTGGDR